MDGTLYQVLQLQLNKLQPIAKASNYIDLIDVSQQV